MRTAKSDLTGADLLVGLGIFVIALLLVGLIILKNNGARSIGPQQCPIDGQPAGGKLAANIAAVGATTMFATTDTSARLIRSHILGGQLANE